MRDRGGLLECAVGKAVHDPDAYRELTGREDGRFRFEKRNSYQAGFGSAGCLIPPHEYHVIANAGDAPAISIHIYGGDVSLDVRKTGYASVYDWLWVNATETTTRDSELMKYPAKTARIPGTISNAEESIAKTDAALGVGLLTETLGQR